MKAISAPQMTLEARPFYEAAAEGRFLIKRCTACGEPHWYPRDLCPFCGAETVWEESPGEGVIYTFSIMRRAREPYAIGYVTLDEGVTLMTNFVGDLEGLAIGGRVKVQFQPTKDGPPVAVFAVAGA